MSPPTVARTRDELDAALAVVRSKELTVALVPTMGALHDGHATLMNYARPRADSLVVSIFVNPTQFAPGEDFEAYPRTFDADLRICTEAGVDLVFAPEVETMYPDGPDAPGITVDPGPLATAFEGASRPTHFRGVLTVVAKLFGLIRPDLAVFGEKDYQQLALIRSMTRDLCLAVDVVGCPIVREADGLAMSSRNRFLSDAERTLATSLFDALSAGADRSSQGVGAVLAAAHAVLAKAPDIDVDYLALTDNDLGEPRLAADARLLVAARIGATRLIDNLGLHLAGTDAASTNGRR